MKKFLIITYLTSLLLNGMAAAWAEVTPAELRLSQDLAESVKIGTVVHLGDAPQNFLAIFLEAHTLKPLGGVIILPDLNSHADWPEVVSPLRRRLADLGWSTLSLQLPAGSASAFDINKNQQNDNSAYNAFAQEVSRRIQLAISYCRNQHITNIVLLGHRFGAILAARFLGDISTPDHSINTLVTVSLYSPIMNSDTLLNNDTLEKIKIPFLEIIPGQSEKYVLQLAQTRKILMERSGHDNYRQILIMGADYTFSDAEITLASRIHTWLAKHSSSVARKR